MHCKTGNFWINDYNPQEAVDNDDGEQYPIFIAKENFDGEI